MLYDHIAGATSYEDALKVLKDLYVKKKNIVSALYLLLNRKQDDGESIDEFVAQLKTLTQACSFKNVQVEQYRNEMLLNVLVDSVLRTEKRCNSSTNSRNSCHIV